ncbi:hypothetical protein F4808DRAFT_458418 [Astrocystis sublimbata]|nr:hypothetical protein F4808DRAFT_458418 [Astrocystis sublimbata]
MGNATHYRRTPYYSESAPFPSIPEEPEFTCDDSEAPTLCDDDLEDGSRVPRPEATGITGADYTTYSSSGPYGMFQAQRGERPVRVEVRWSTMERLLRLLSVGSVIVLLLGYIFYCFLTSDFGATIFQAAQVAPDYVGAPAVAPEPFDTEGGV